jgi:CheY-like chemotaxis protein
MVEVPAPEAARGKTVLIVDDHPSMRRLLQVLLEPWGCSVLTAEHGEAGLELLAHQRVDVIIVEYLMPGLFGPEFIEAYLRTPPPHAPIIVVSGGLVGDHDWHSPWPVGVLERPINQAELSAMLQAALGG